jgi:hypothetical protein
VIVMGKSSVILIVEIQDELPPGAHLVSVCKSFPNIITKIGLVCLIGDLNPELLSG